MIVLPDAENRTIVSSFVWTKHRNVTDRRTDRQRESLWLFQQSALRASGRAVKSIIPDPQWAHSCLIKAYYAVHTHTQLTAE